MWTVRSARRAAGAVIAAAALVAGPAALAAAQDGPSGAGSGGSGGAVTNDVTLDLDRGGVMSAEESLFFGGEPPEEFTRTFVVRTAYDSDHERRYAVSGVSAEDGDGKPVEVDVDTTGNTLTMRFAPAEQVTLRYDVRGGVDRVGQRQELEWAAVGGYSAPVETTTVQVDAGAPPVALACAAGDPRSSIYCTSSDMGGHEAVVARFTQARLEPGQQLSIVVGYPAGTMNSEAILDRVWSVNSAFAITPATTTVFGLVLVVLVGGLVALIRVRSRDERALRAEAANGEAPPLRRAGRGRMRFHPPDNVHPGQIGTLIDEQADVVDITATVVDLAVRGHLEIRELSHRQFSAVDWELTATGGPAGAEGGGGGGDTEGPEGAEHTGGVEDTGTGDADDPDDPEGGRDDGDTEEPPDELLEYERLLLTALFRDGGSVRVSQLNGAGDTEGSERAQRFTEELAAVRDEMYRDMVRLKWFARSPNLERNRWTGTGITITLAGVALTALLAVFTHAAFTGLAVIIAGAAVTVGAQYMPAKTKLGSAVYAHTLGFSRFLHSAAAEDIPVDEGRRVELFSRYLPYAIIFDNVDHWARALARAGAEELDRDDLPWYHGPEEWRISDFADSITMFSLTLSGIISNSRQFKTLK
ncbi:putative membrane protein DUF2207 [Murinocardiopsis flavida]|uniref:Putative membrane protein DUF2207 n=1 Tax=Murinocardiopsis flavida TaxID=645275 RepID=A0A2P8DQZ2_9ACTN|nr:DUF2207 domain-containing protein [Murinocardiopsis flavida]PSK99630.1 putative membrane protein DUF2207 [Murinocardiopsis flavida]